MRVLFLDLDGVLVTKDTMTWPMVPIPAACSGYLPFRRGFHQFHAESVKNLNRIVEATGAKIVISSSWRIGFWRPEQFKVLKNYLYYQGVEGEIIGLTGRDPRGTGKRGHEIQDWLDEHPEVTSMVILDDNTDMEHLMPYLVITSWKKGIVENHVERAIKLLHHKSRNKNDTTSRSTH